MKARIGKIARLPSAVRDELNRRLLDGALGKDLVPWLNALPDVQRILAERFAGRPISEQNLSEWRHGGFQDWLQEQDRRQRLHQLAADFPGMRELDAPIQKRLVEELAEELERLSALQDRAERFKQLLRLSHEFCRLQRSHNRGLEIGLFQARGQTLPTHSSLIHAGSKLLKPSQTKNHGG